MTIRARLALWYALALASLMVAFAAASYALLARWSMQRIDRSLEETARAIATAWLTGGATAVGTSPPSMDILSRFATGNLEIVVLDQANIVVARTPRDVPGLMERSRPASLLALVEQVAGATGVLATVAGEDGSRRAFAMAMHAAGRRQLVVVAQDLGERASMLAHARRASTVAIAAALTLALVGGYLVAWHALTPVAMLASQARRISASTIHERLRARDEHDELGQLTRAFNDLLARLDRAFEQQRQFMADASHELRTPIAVVRGEADVALAREERPPEEYRESLAVIRDEARHMSRLVADLLLLARSDAAVAPLSASDFYLDELIAESIRAVRTLATERAVTVRYEPGREMPMRGDETLLRRLVTNLLDNAIKYGAAGGEVTVRADRDAAGNYAIAVADRGPGIPAAIRDRLFDRFVRGPESHDAPLRAGGAGLGLAIARRIAEVHSGSLELTRTGSGGTEFQITLPRSAPAAAGVIGK